MKVAKKLAVVGMSLVMAFAMTACGGGEDTKETITKTVEDCSAIMSDAMTQMGTGLMSMVGLSDASQIPDAVKPIVDKMDEANKKLDEVATPGEDSKKFRDTVKEIVTLVRDMFNEFSGVSDLNAMSTIQEKYQPQMDELTKKTQDLAKELGDKYGIDLNSMLNTSAAQEESFDHEDLSTDDTEEYTDEDYSDGDFSDENSSDEDFSDEYTDEVPEEDETNQ